MDPKFAVLVCSELVAIAGEHTSAMKLGLVYIFRPVWNLKLRGGRLLVPTRKCWKFWMRCGMLWYRSSSKLQWKVSGGSVINVVAYLLSWKWTVIRLLTLARIFLLIILPFQRDTLDRSAVENPCWRTMDTEIDVEWTCPNILFILASKAGFTFLRFLCQKRVVHQVRYDSEQSVGRQWNLVHFLAHFFNRVANMEFLIIFNM